MAHPLSGNADTTALWLFNAASEPTPEEIGGSADSQFDNVNDGDPPLYQADGWGIASSQDATDYALDSNANSDGILTPNADDYLLWQPSAKDVIAWELVIRFEEVSISQFFTCYSSGYGVVPQLVNNSVYWQIGCSDGNGYRWTRHDLSDYLTDWLYLAAAWSQSDASTLVSWHGNLTHDDASVTGSDAVAGTGITFQAKNAQLKPYLINDDLWMSAFRVRNLDSVPSEADFNTEYAKVLNWTQPGGGGGGIQPYTMHHLTHNCNKDDTCGLIKPTDREVITINSRRYDNAL